MAAKAALLLGLFCPTQSLNGVDPCTALVDWHSEADAGCDLFLAAGATCESAWNEICGEDNPAGAEYNSWSLSSSGCSQCATTCSGPHLSDPEALCHVWLEAGATCDSTWLEVCGVDHPNGTQFNDWPLSQSRCSQCATICSGYHLLDIESTCAVWLAAGETCDSTWVETCGTDHPSGSEYNEVPLRATRCSQCLGGSASPTSELDCSYVDMSLGCDYCCDNRALDDCSVCRPYYHCCPGGDGGAGATCSDSWCTSQGASPGESDCWAGATPTIGDGCTCSKGEARLSGESTTYEWEGVEYRFERYVCCTRGETVRDQCGQYTGCTDPTLCESTAYRIAHGGREREYTVITPPGKAEGGNAVALVVGIHGWTQTAQWACQAMLQPYVRQWDVVGLCPQGVLAAAGGQSGWNTASADGGDGDGGGLYEDDDVGFIMAARDEVLARYSVTDSLTYVIGFSFGGNMAYRLMCEESDRLSGFAVVGQEGPWANSPPPASMPWAAACAPAVPRPLWVGIGTEDWFYTAARAEEGWKAVATSVLGCSGSITTSRPLLAASSGGMVYNGSVNPKVSCQSYEACASGAATAFCTYEGMPHIYPSTSGAPQTDETDNGVGESHQATIAAWALWSEARSHGSSRYTSPGPPPSAHACVASPDFDGDGNFRLADAVFIAEAWAGKKELPPGVCGDPPGDFDGDGAFRLADAVFLAEVWAGKKSFSDAIEPTEPTEPTGFGLYSYSECSSRDEECGGSICTSPYEYCAAWPCDVSSAGCEESYSYSCLPCGAIAGRPYVVDGLPRLPKAVASDRGKAVAPPLNGRIPNSVLSAAGHHWAVAGGAEWASVASFSKHSLELLANGAPAHLISGMHTAALEEVGHAEAAYALATSYLGVAVGPSALDTRDSGEVRSLPDVAVSTAREGCVAETVAAIEAQLTLAACIAPAACAALAVVANDEASHAALAWRELEWAIGRQPSLATTLKGVLSAAAAALLAKSGASRAAAGDDGEVDAAALAAHGVPSAQLRARAGELAATLVIRPGAEALHTGGVAARVEWLLRDALAEAGAGPAFVTPQVTPRAANATCRVQS